MSENRLTLILYIEYIQRIYFRTTRGKQIRFSEIINKQIQTCNLWKKKKNKTKQKQKQKQKQKKKEENKRKAYQSGIILGGFALHYRVKDQPRQRSD